MNLSSSQLLKKLFDIKKKSRPGFSIRAFAKALKISPSFANAILQGKKPISQYRKSPSEVD